MEAADRAGPVRLLRARRFRFINGTYWPPADSRFAYEFSRLDGLYLHILDTSFVKLNVVFSTFT